MNKLALVTRADDNITEMTDITHPFLRAYAEQIGADFIIYDHEPEVWTDDRRPHYRILKAKETLQDYDRILFMDSDVLVNNDCPNIFDVVPEDHIGSIYEDVGTRFHDRHRKMFAMQRQWGDLGWPAGYTNAGVFVVSKEHAPIFDPHNGKYWLGWGSADLHMAYMAKKNGFPIHELPFQWNHMTMFSEAWNKHADRFESHMIHYAGRGTFDTSSRIDQIRKDAEEIRRRA